MSKFFTILTRIGAAKFANATALGSTVKLEKLAVGDGGGTLPTPRQEQTALVNEVRRELLNSVDVDKKNPNWILCEQVIPENEGGWTIREVGLYDVDGDLIAVGNFPETYKPVLEEGSGRTQTIRVVIQVSAASSVELKIDPSIVLATRDYVDQSQRNQNLLIQSMPYEPNRTYYCGDICTTMVNGKTVFWEAYHQIPFKDKDPKNIQNRQSGWTDDTQPFYWTPAKKSRPGSPLWPWMSMTIPEGTLNVIGNSVPLAVFWRLAEVFPEFVNQSTGMIDFPETRGEFFRVLDHGRGVDPNRGCGSAQLDTIQGNKRILRLQGGEDLTIHGFGTVDAGSLFRIPLVGPDGDIWRPTDYMDDGHGTPRVGDETRSRNLAFPFLVEV